MKIKELLKKGWWEILNDLNTQTKSIIIMQLMQEEIETTQIEMKSRLNALDSQNKHPNISNKHSMTVKVENLRCEIVKLERFLSSKSRLASSKLPPPSSVPLCKTPLLLHQPHLSVTQTLSPSPPKKQNTLSDNPLLITNLQLPEKLTPQATLRSSLTTQKNILLPPSVLSSKAAKKYPNPLTNRICFF